MYKNARKTRENAYKQTFVKIIRLKVQGIVVIRGIKTLSILKHLWAIGVCLNFFPCLLLIIFKHYIHEYGTQKS